MMVRANVAGVFCTYKWRATPKERRYWYHRKTGRRLHGEPGSPLFLREFAEAERLSSERHAGQLVDLIRRYTGSSEFNHGLAQSTQRERKRMLTTAEVEFDGLPLVALDDPGIRADFLKWREHVAHTSGNREADNRLSSLSAMLSWAVEHGIIAANHLKGFKRLYHSDRADIVWEQHHIQNFMAVAALPLQQAMLLAIHTGLRQSDILKLPWSAYDGQAIVLQPGKNARGGRRAKPIRIPCTSTLRDMLNSMPRVSPLILTTKTGRAFKKRYFAEQWGLAMKAARIQDVIVNGGGPTHLHFNDLRGTAVTMLCEASCTPQEIASITGHSLARVSDILSKYISYTRPLAENAISKFENSPRTKFANSMQTKTATK